VIDVMDEYLATTLHALGVPKQVSYATIASSGPSVEENRVVYAKVNSRLGELVSATNLGNSIHVTGELRALSDPQHQDVCIANFQRHGTRLQFIGHIPESVRREPYLLLEQDIEAWRSSRDGERPISWGDELAAFEIAGEEIVEIYGTTEREPLHYSVFPANYVLLQEQHDPTLHPAKRVWLLQSEEISQALRQRTREALERAQRISPAYFDRLPTYAASIQALEHLSRLRDGTATQEPEHDVPWFRTIKALGFVGENGKGITKAGCEYLESFVRSDGA